MSIAAIEEAKRRIQLKHFRLELADTVELWQPITLESLAGKLTASIAEVDLEIGYGDMVVSNRRLKRWTDFTPVGQGREFLGTVGTLGFAEPDEPEPREGELALIDPRTLLAMIRAIKGINVKALATRFGVTFGAMMEAVRQLSYAGHVFHRKQPGGYWAIMATRPPKRCKTIAR